MRTVLRCATPALIVAVLILAPFREKAFTIDDTSSLYQARHALVDPLHPAAFDMVWDLPVRARGSAVPNGPVMAWLLVPAMLAGGSEPVAHVTVLATMVLAIIATVALALRLGLAPTAATVAGLLLAGTPSALAMAGTAMADVPAMALGVAGLERLVAWRDGRRLTQAIAAIVFLALAPLTRSHLVLLLGVGAFLVAGDYLQSRRAGASNPWTVWLPLIVAPLFSVGITLATRDPQRGSVGFVRMAATASSLGNVPLNIASFLTHWVLALPLALPWILLRPSSIARRWWVFLLATGAAAALLTMGQAPRMLASAPIAGLGATVLVDVLMDAWRRRDSLQLTLALWLFVALPVAIYVHLPSKYLLASAPAVALLVAREMERARAAARWVVPVTLVAGVSLGIAVLRADAAFANLGRRAAEELIAPNVAAGHRVWFAGGWGFQWYAERAGGTILSLEEPRPAPGDLLVTSENTNLSLRVKRMLVEDYGRRVTRLATVEDSSPGGRVMDGSVGAGFFSNRWGNYPWAWGSTLLDAFILWRID
jgi:hypothetical protein